MLTIVNDGTLILSPSEKAHASAFSINGRRGAGESRLIERNGQTNGTALSSSQLLINPEQ